MKHCFFVCFLQGNITRAFSFTNNFTQDSPNSPFSLKNTHIILPIVSYVKTLQQCDVTNLLSQGALSYVLQPLIQKHCTHCLRSGKESLQIFLEGLHFIIQFLDSFFTFLTEVFSVLFEFLKEKVGKWVILPVIWES